MYGKRELPPRACKKSHWIVVELIEKDVPLYLFITDSKKTAKQEGKRMLEWKEGRTIRTSTCDKLNTDKILVIMNYPNLSPKNSEITGVYTWDRPGMAMAMQKERERCNREGPGCVHRIFKAKLNLRKNLNKKQK